MQVNEAAFVQPRLAATVLLVRDAPFEVLMVKRNARGPFASAFVFPGGVVEENDYSESWLPYLQSGEHATAEERALRIAACRETWEEVSILPGGTSCPAPTSAAPPSFFFEYVARGGIRLALSELVLFSHWITPLSAPKRFDTHFFICRTDVSNPGQCDGTETVALEWVQPRHALASAERGDRSFLLPTHENLRLLAGSTNADEAIGAARGRTVLPIMPRRVVIGDTVTFTISESGE
jgi:8-oxo-dGTP pyrophosphatase MutT (NUDIX family)